MFLARKRYATGLFAACVSSGRCAMLRKAQPALAGILVDDAHDAPTCLHR